MLSGLSFPAKIHEGFMSLQILTNGLLALLARLWKNRFISYRIINLRPN